MFTKLLIVFRAGSIKAVVQVYEFESVVSAADLQQMILHINKLPADDSSKHYISYNNSRMPIIRRPQALALDEEDDTVMGERVVFGFI